MSRSLRYDIRAEVWAAQERAAVERAALGQTGLNETDSPASADLVIRARGTFSRPFSPDVLTVDEVTGDAGQTSVTYADVSRDGLYDSLPEALAHPVRPVRPGDEWAADAVAESRRLHREEAEARRFWLPFEQETFRQRVRIEAQESEALTGRHGPVWDELHDWLLGPAAANLSPEQRASLLRILINAHRIVGNWPLTARAMSQFLRVPVALRFGPQSTGGVASQRTGQAAPVRIGACRLGEDFIVAQPIPTDDGGQVRIQIGPLTGDRLADFLPNGTGEGHVRLLAGYLLPADADYVLTIVPEPADAAFQLTNTPTTGRLGLTTRLA